MHLSLLLTSALFFIAGSASAHAASVIQFFPTGSVKQVQQVTVRFSTDMVALGDPRSKSDPFSMTCNEATQKQEADEDSPSAAKKSKVPKYSTRWADTRNWVLDFEKPLAAGMKCVFKMKSGLNDLSGAAVEAYPAQSFSTAGPALLEVAPRYGNIDPDQYFVAQIDGPLDLMSVETGAYFEVSGLPDKVQARVIQGAEREAVVRAAIGDNWSWNEFEALLKQKPPRPFSQIKQMDNFLVIAGTRRFPESAKVVLHWTKGVRSVSGLPVEEEQNFEFEVIKPFEATFSCDRTAPDRACNPILGMRVEFTRRLPLKSLVGAQLEGPGGKIWRPTELKKGDQNKNGVGAVDPKGGVAAHLISNFADEQVSALTFEPPFPESTRFKLILPGKLKDELGRDLANQNKFPLEVATDEYSPLIKFAAPFGILELKGDPVLPVSLRNVEKQLPVHQVSIEGKSLTLTNRSSLAEFVAWHERVTTKDSGFEYGEDGPIDSRTRPLLDAKAGVKFNVPKPAGERDFELIGIPLKKPGLHIVEMVSPRLGAALTESKAPMYVAAAALVTDMAVHLKRGRESTLVWVTALSSAKPVSGAAVNLVDAVGNSFAQGTTGSDGIARFGRINYPCDWNGIDDLAENKANSCAVYAFAQKGDDISYVSSQWTKGIESYRFGVRNEYLAREWGPIVLHTILDRMAVQPGEKVQMKHVLREHRAAGFSWMNPKRLPKRVLVVHEASAKTYTLPFQYDAATGSAVGTFAVPKDATLGRYVVYLSNRANMPKAEAGDGDAFDWSAQATGEFVVTEYRLPLMKAALKVQGEPLLQPKDVNVDLSAGYLSGGPAKNLKVKLRAQLGPGSFTPDVPGASEYRFFTTPLKPGVFDSDNRQEPDPDYMKVQDLTLDGDGGVLAAVKGLPAIKRIHSLSLEMEYTDPNGEVKTAATQTTLFPAEFIVGLRSDGWYTEPGKTKVIGVVTDIHGKPRPGQGYVVEAFQTNYVTHRKRIVGGFYSYDSKSEIKPLGTVCEGRSDDLGLFNCVPKKLPSGSITLQAKVRDSKGRFTYASADVHVYAEGSQTWWTPSDSDRIDVLPEKTRYEPGEKAKIIVRSPYPQATALVTVERQGVLESFVTEVRRDNPSIEVPMKPHFAPNVFVSVLLIRGRVADPKPTALLDLARPAMKMGIAEIKVGWKAHELLVNVKTDKTKYKAREKSQVQIQVRAATGAQLPAGAEVAVAAVDEALLRLKQNSSWQILEAMMGERGLSVETSSAQNQVIGRRHFGSKAKPPGGGGGMAADPRQLFDPILLWQAKAKLDENGRASVLVPLNDSMTSFRIVAVAQAGEGLFGHGATTIESSKDLILYPGFAPLVREGDQIKNAFTLRNTTTQPMKVKLQISSSEIPNLAALPSVELGPSEAKTMVLPLTVPPGLKEFGFKLSAKDSVLGAEDGVIVKTRVEPAVPPRVLQATLFQLEKPQQIPVRQPADALPGRGGLAVHARATLATGLAGVKSYMLDYPYTCLEQRVSKAVVLEDRKEIKSLIEDLPSYADSSGLFKFFPVSPCGSAQLTRYVLSILPANGFEIPAATRDQALAGIQATLEGRASCSNWWDELVRDAYANESKVLLMETLSRYKAFSSNYLSTIQVTPNVWKTETVTAWYNLLKREPTIPNQKTLLGQAENLLRARVNFQGSLMNLQGDLNWEAQWRLFSSRDQEALGVFGVSIDEPAWSQDVGRMARGIVARLRKGHWDTTMANAWGVTQFRRFSAKFEKEKITGETKVSAPELVGLFNWKTQPFGEKKAFAWPKGSESANVPVQFAHAGGGKPWIHLETLSAIPLKKPFDMGYKISRKILPVLQATPGQWRVGDVANVEVTVTAKADQPWVVVRDPIPAGAAHLGTGLDGTSKILDRAPKVNAPAGEVQAWPTEYEEKSHANLIAYAAYLPRGTYRLNYRIRLNSAGDFKLPPSRVEAMYSPETFGEVPIENWKVAP